jgi:hypothetical protein
MAPKRPTGVEEGMLWCATSCVGAARRDLACVLSARIPLQGLHMRSCIIVCRAPAQPHSALVLGSRNYTYVRLSRAVSSRQPRETLRFGAA